MISKFPEKTIKDIHLKLPSRVRFLETFRCQLSEGSLKLLGKVGFKGKEE